MIAPDSLLFALLSATAKASVLLAAAFVITTLMRRASAASRHVVWIAAFAGALLMPVASVVMPDVTVRVLPVAMGGHDESEHAGRAIAIAELEAARTTLEANVTALQAERAAIAASTADAEHAIHAQDPLPIAGSRLPVNLFLLWTAGCVIVGVAFAVGVLRTHLLACQAAPADGLLAEEAEVIAAELGIARDVRLVVWPGPAMPMTWGALRPVVLVPDAARDWPAERRREVLTHELAHVARHDWLVRVLAAAVCAVQWFNPLAWMASRKLRDEQELACDDAVLALGAQPSAYAQHLLEVARACRSPLAGIAGSVAMARPSQLTGRLLAMLDETKHRAPAPGSARLAWMFMAALTLPLAAAMPVARSAAPDHHEIAAAGVVTGVGQGVGRGIVGGVKGGKTVRAATTAQAAALAGEAPVAAVAVVAASDERCPELRGRNERGRNHNSISSHDDGRPNRTTLTLEQGDCRLEVRIIGNVVFAEDESDIVSMPAGASVRVTEEDRELERRFESWLQNGRVTRRWRLNGNEVDESDELRRWLADALQTAFARTGYNIVPRTMRAYRAGGADSVVRLVEDFSSDYSKRKALTTLLDSFRISAADAARMARVAPSMPSDYEKTELLIAIAREVPLDGVVQEAVIASAASMSSDYEKRRLLTAALERSDLTSQATAGLLGVAGRMSSDYEKVELLLAWLRARPFDEGRRVPFFATANSITSDYERRRLLTAVVAAASAPGNTMIEVAGSSEQMSSDYERAELLLAIMRKFGTHAATRQAVYRAAERMSSDHEKNRVLAQLARQ